MCTLFDLQHVGSLTVYPVMQAQGATGWQTSYHNFIINMWNHYINPNPPNVGCDWFFNRYSLWTSQLPNITNTYQQELKQSKIFFAMMLGRRCQCHSQFGWN